MYIQNHDVLINKASNGIPTVYAIDTSTESEYSKRPTSANGFLQEQMRDSNCDQSSFTVGLPGFTFNYDWNRVLIHAAPIYRAVKKVVPTSLRAHLLYH